MARDIVAGGYLDHDGMTALAAEFHVDDVLMGLIKV